MLLNIEVYFLSFFIASVTGVFTPIGFELGEELDLDEDKIKGVGIDIDTGFKIRIRKGAGMGCSTTIDSQGN